MTEFDWIIRRGNVIDGSGAAKMRADVGIRGDRIAAVEDLSGALAAKGIDAGGRVVAPGFIDVHNHSEGWLLKLGHLSFKTRQGFTTEVLMSDGISYVPLKVIPLPISEPLLAKITGNGTTIAVAGLSFEVAPGQILGLVGSNGAGKTTTLRAISGILSFARGQITVAGYDVERETIEVKKRLAYLPDEPQLFPYLSVEQHLAFTASVYAVSQGQETADKLLQNFNLASQCKTLAGNLSRGMRQKLAICCAYLYTPTAMLFDETLTGLDPHGIRTFKQSLRRAEDGAAVIVSSHLLAMVEDVCTDVLILADGRQQYVGPISQLRSTFGVDEPAGHW